MTSYKFKTSLKCNGCVAAIKPGMEAINGIEKWTVNLGNPGSELQVEGKPGLEQTIVNTVQSAGYKIEQTS